LSGAELHGVIGFDSAKGLDSIVGLEKALNAPIELFDMTTRVTEAAEQQVTPPTPPTTHTK
jgi:hypothetical protein